MYLNHQTIYLSTIPIPSINDNHVNEFSKFLISNLFKKIF